MNYLSNYYKNLSEQLESKVKTLKKQLMEVAQTSVEMDTSMNQEGGGFGSGNNQTTPNFFKGIQIAPWKVKGANYQPGTVINFGGKLYRYEGDGVWSVQGSDKKWYPFIW